MSVSDKYHFSFGKIFKQQNCCFCLSSKQPVFWPACRRTGGRTFRPYGFPNFGNEKSIAKMAFRIFLKAMLKFLLSFQIFGMILERLGAFLIGKILLEKTVS
jgi:hypothetical protein